MLIVTGININRLSVLMVEYSENPSIPSREEKLAQLRKAREPREKKKPKPIAPISKKRAAKLAEEKKAGVDGKMDMFFDEMIKRCTSKCLFCNSETTAINTRLYRDDNAKWSEEANEKKYQREIEILKRASIAHLLPKRSIDKGGFPSVATHEDNWIELCWQCHTSFDTGKITWEFLYDSAEWPVIKEKLLNVLPAVAEEERGHKLYGKLQKLVYEAGKGR
jgi:hypothetical protein